MRSRTRLAVLFLVAIALLAFVAPAFAVAPGKQGRILFTSGRTGGDATAQIFQINPVNSFGPGAATALTPVIAATQYRHASMSPDRTKMVVARGTPGSLATENYDLFIRDMTTGTITPLDAAETNSNDHPAWSPDGTKIAYEHQPAAASTERDIKIKTVGGGPAVNLTTDNAAPFQLKPAWSPDSQRVYFAQSPVPTGGATENFNIVSKAANAPAAGPVTNHLTTAQSEYQPSISPDGTKICYTEQTPAQQATTEIFIQDLPAGGNKRNISDNPAGGDINCSYSPDGNKVAYSQGIFGAAKLMVEFTNDNDNSPPGAPLSDDPAPSDTFDGNADWAIDGSPDCPDTTATTQPGQPVTLQLECTDTGPAYERTDPNGTVANDGGPQNGTLSDFSPLTNPSTVRYTPKQFFKGTDTIKYTAFDSFGFGTDQGTLTITVDGPINGTAGNDTIDGTAGNDVINCGAGNDVVNGGGGDDVINCGAGDDRVNGGAGNDQVNGEDGNDQVGGDAGDDQVGGGNGDDQVNGNEGNDAVNGDDGTDTASGGDGNDRMTGGAGNDLVNGNSGGDRVNGNSGNDRLGGDANRDRMNGDSGRDRVSGGSSNDRVRGGSGNDRVRGNSGNDRVGGDSGNDRVGGDSGRDIVSGGRGNDRVSGGSSNDRVGGDSGRDRVSGDSGRDRLNGGRGRDRCDGGRGRDRARSCERRRRIP